MNPATCTKKFGPFPFAHRQHKHDGHCALIHGHNWVFSLTFEAPQLDSNGFVVDFGKLQVMKGWLTHLFDHTLVLNEDDPARENLTTFLSNCYNKDNTSQAVAKITVLPNGGAEGLAKYVFEEGLKYLPVDAEVRGVRIQSVTVYEDEKNSATYSA